MSEAAVKETEVENKTESELGNDQVTCQICVHAGRALEDCRHHVISTHVYRESDEAHKDFVEEAKKLMSEDVAALDPDSRDYKRALNEAINKHYQAEFGESAPLMSDSVRQALAAKRSVQNRANPKEEKVVESEENDSIELRPMHAVFGLTRSKATRDADGNDILVEVMKEHDYQYMVPKINPDYVWDISLLKTIVMGVENKIPAYLWGYAGVGKSTGFEQYCAYTNRPFMRAQHTGDTESAHIIGQTLANESGTYFNPGPLALAMKHGWFYLADEYDFAFPQVTSVYQPVLEGKDLLIKEADEEWRLVEAHKNFYMAGTGNTNGAGDESGLFQGTNLQNAANYERFSIVLQVKYLEAKKEVRLISNKLDVDGKHIEPIIDFVNRVRGAFVDGKINNTAGQRVSMAMGKIWKLTGSYQTAAELAFINRLPEASRKVVSDLAQRVFG